MQLIPSNTLALGRHLSDKSSPNYGDSSIWACLTDFFDFGGSLGDGKILKQKNLKIQLCRHHIKELLNISLVDK